MNPKEKHEVWFALADAFKLRPRESLEAAALRVLRRKHPAWAAAQIVLRSERLRGAEAWTELARARDLLPGPGNSDRQH